MSEVGSAAKPLVPRSDTPGLVWPAAPHPAGAAMLTMQYQLERSQWQSEDALRKLQVLQLRLLAAHAVVTVPYYKDHLATAGLADVEDISPTTYLRWPTIGPTDVGTLGERLRASGYPKEHGRSFESFTSGATGSPKRIANTEVAQFFAHALVLRDHLWHRRDFSAKFGAIRFFATEGRSSTWSRITSAVFATGPAVELDVTTDIPRQFDWLLSEKPNYLLTSPSNLAALLDRSRDVGRSPQGLRQVITYAEFLPAKLRGRVRDAWGVPLMDSYSCTEAGALALQCPDHEHYHVQCENVYLEVLREVGTPCAPGETGRVVITPLHNFAMPLMRYDLGDYATLGEPCACGRGLPVIRNVLGRARNLARDPSGRHYQPGFDQALDEAGLPVRQFQFIQQTPELIEMSYVMDRELSGQEMERFQAAVKTSLPYPFEIRFRRVDAIARSPGGKYEGFISRVASA